MGKEESSSSNESKQFIALNSPCKVVGREDAPTKEASSAGSCKHDEKLILAAVSVLLIQRWGCRFKASPSLDVSFSTPSSRFAPLESKSCISLGAFVSHLFLFIIIIIIPPSEERLRESLFFFFLQVLYSTN